MSLRFKFILVVMLVLTVVSIALIDTVGGALDQAQVRTGERAQEVTQQGIEESINVHFSKVAPRVVEAWIDSSLEEHDRSQPIEIRRILSGQEGSFRKVRLYQLDEDGKLRSSELAPNANFAPVDAEDTIAAVDRTLMKPDGGRTQVVERRVVTRIGEGKPALFVGLEFDLPPFEIPSIPPTDVDVSRLRDAVTWPLVIGGVLLVLVLLVALWLFVVAPLRTLDEASKRIARGDYSRAVPARSSRDEMARLISTFNMMQTEVRQYQDEMEARIEDAREEISRKERTLVVAQRLAATGTLAAGLAHEINNPLGGMKNAVRRLQKKTEDDRDREYLGMIEEGLGRIETLMGQILDFSRRRDAKPEKFDFVDVANRSLAFVRHRFDTRIALATEIPEGSLDGYGMPSSIQQVIINLLINARDACNDKPKAEVKVALRGLDDGVELIVKDSGAGMDDATVEHIFDPFYTTKEPGKGTGLGLSIIHNIVQSHDGIISVESVKDEGTTFTIFFPNHREETAVEKVLNQRADASAKSDS